jgi:phosphopantetheinyl transferase
MTRNCPAPAYTFPTVFSFFTSRNTLTGGVEVFSILKREPYRHCLALIDLERLDGLLHNEQKRKNFSSLLTREERDIFRSFSYPKRQIEWLGGRIACKTAILLLFNKNPSGEQMNRIAVLPGDGGSPEIGSEWPFELPPAVSISHSKRFAVGMAARTAACGVDVQKVTDQTRKVVNRFAEPDEIILLAEKIPVLDELQRLSLLWSAKEAVKKTLFKNQPVIFQGVLLKRLQINKFIKLCLQCPGRKKRLAAVQAAVLADYILTFTGETESCARTS